MYPMLTPTDTADLRASTVLMARIIGINIIRINTVSDDPATSSSHESLLVQSGALPELTVLVTSALEKVAFARVSARLSDIRRKLQQPQRQELRRQEAYRRMKNPALESCLDGWMS